MIDGLIEHGTFLKTVYRPIRRSEVARTKGQAASIGLLQANPMFAAMTEELNSHDADVHRARTKMHRSMKMLRTEIGQPRYLTHMPG